MNRPASLAALLFSVLAFAGTARAQDQAANEATGGYETPQAYAFELKFGPYRPDVDEEFGGKATPYQTFFGSGQHFLAQAELDYQLWHGFGSLGVGGQVGYVSQSAHAFVLTPAGTLTSPPMRSPSDTTTFSILPVAALAVYRFDVPWRRWRIPITPYAKLGLAYDLWWITDGTGGVATCDSLSPCAKQGGVGRGATTGWEAAVGIGFLLDWIDPASARELDNDLGINHTYLGFEYAHSAINDFGGSHALNVGDDTWNLGLTFEF